MIYRARWMVTMRDLPQEDGAVVVADSRFVDSGPADQIAAAYPDHEVSDLGDRILMPGLINAHCHLDYTMMRGAIDPPKSFTDWIVRINALKRSLDEEDYVKALRQGFEELIKWGTTTVLNIESFPELMFRLPPPPIRTWWFYEMIDLRQRVATEDLVAGALSFFQARPDWLGGFGLSPHSPYTASSSLYELANACAAMTDMPLTTHVAESVEEEEMFRNASGKLYEFVASLGRPMDDCGSESSLGRLMSRKLLNENWIVVHLNELSPVDLRQLRSSKFHVVHCPRSHQYFRHRKFNFKEIRDAGFNICLGTDSLASNTSLSLFAEMQALQKIETHLRANELVAMVTTNPARALKHEGRIGQITPGAHADLIAFRCDAGEPYDQIVNNSAPVEWMMLNGNVLRNVLGSPGVISQKASN
jgi:cytosine/adenosine deaminase-related metal-dependent hydrolase